MDATRSHTRPHRAPPLALVPLVLVTVAACGVPADDEPVNIPTATPTTVASAADDLRSWRATAERRTDEIQTALDAAGSGLGTPDVVTTLADVCLDIEQGRDEPSVQTAQRERLRGLVDEEPSAEAMGALVDVAQRYVCPR